MSSSGGFTNSTLLEKELARQAEQPLLASCGICDWTWEGTVGDGLVKAREHREAEHPETFGKKTRRRSARSLHTFRARATDEELAQEVETERRRRAFVHGVEIED